MTEIKWRKLLVKDDGVFPNNNKLPVILYEQVTERDGFNTGRRFIELFERNNWSNAWENGIFEVHHYHSTAHEVLGIAGGFVEIQLGGPTGELFRLVKGDVIVLPAGVAHKNAQQSENFICIGAYADGRQYDLNYGKAGEREQTEKNILQLPLPTKDPVQGTDGILKSLWA